MNNKQRVDVLLSELADTVYDEIPAHGPIARVILVDTLGLNLSSYPKHSPTQGERSWLAAILLRRLEDAGRVECVIQGGTIYYRRTGK